LLTFISLLVSPYSFAQHENEEIIFVETELEIVDGILVAKGLTQFPLYDVEIDGVTYTLGAFTSNDVVKVSNIQTSEIICETATLPYDAFGGFTNYKCEIPIPEEGNIVLSIVPSKEANPVNGVSALDLLQIKKDISGVQTISYPFRRIMGDVDGERDGLDDGDPNDPLNESDLEILSKLILGDNSALRVPSWQYLCRCRFGGPGNEGFTEAFYANPFEIVANGGPSISPYPDYLGPSNVLIGPSTVSISSSRFTFYALKSGDVNGMAAGGGTLFLDRQSNEGVKNRDSEPFSVNTQSSATLLQEGEIAIVSLQSETLTELSAFQTGLFFDPEYFDFLEFLPATIHLGDNNFGFSSIDRGEIRSLWVDPQGSFAEVEKGGSVLRLKFRIKKTVVAPVAPKKWNDWIGVRQTIMPSEFVKKDNSLISLENFTLKLDLIDAFGSSQGNIHVFPNPTAGKVNVFYHAISSGNGEISLYNAAGQRVRSESIVIESGDNLVKITGLADLPKGIYFLKLTSPAGVSLSSFFVK